MRLELLPAGLALEVTLAECDLAVLRKCFYWYTRDYEVAITLLHKEIAHVRLTLKEPGGTPPAGLPAQVRNDLLDFQLRAQISAETRTVRELLLAKAFAHYAPEQSQEAPITDPVGFHPLDPILPA